MKDEALVAEFKALYPDGVRDTVLRFESAGQDGETLAIHLHDALEPLQITLQYRVHAAHDLIERWAEIANTGSRPITLERVLSAQWHLPRERDYRLSHLYGRWANEWNLCRELLTPGVKILDSRRLTTSHQANPWFAVDVRER